jgi:hypothetical protein
MNVARWADVWPAADERGQMGRRTPERISKQFNLYYIITNNNGF